MTSDCEDSLVCLLEGVLGNQDLHPGFCDFRGPVSGVCPACLSEREESDIGLLCAKLLQSCLTLRPHEL